MQRFVGWLAAIFFSTWVSVMVATPASAVIIRPAVSGLPGLTVTPGFSMSFYIPKNIFFFLPNPDYPTNPNNVGEVELFLEQPTIIGRDVVHVGKGSANKKKNPSGQIYVIDVKNYGILTFFYPSVINNFVVTLPSYIGRVTNLQWEVFDVVQVVEPPQAVPVPPAVLLLGSGVAGLAGISRKRKKSA